jgi:hypothetical protein
VDAAVRRQPRVTLRPRARMSAPSRSVYRPVVTPSIRGMPTSVDDKQIVLRLADGTTRILLVRPQDAIDGTDYVVSAHETEPLG